MSIEPTDTTTHDVDKTHGVVPEGGFSPIRDLDASPPAATMPPAPGAWAAPPSSAPTGDETSTDEGFPPPSAPGDAEPVAVPEPDLASGVAAHGASSDSGVILFGEDSGTPASGPWATEDDAELILPIEPARLGPWGAAVMSENPLRVEDHTTEVDTSGGLTPDEVSPDEAHAVEPGEIVALLTDRLSRALAPLIVRVAAFLDDDGTHLSTGWLPGSVVCLAGSELVGVLDESPEELFGTSLELGAARHIPLGVRIPIVLVRQRSDEASVGGLEVTAVSGSLEFVAVLDSQVVVDVAAEITRGLAGLTDDVERLREEHGVAFTEITLDAAGGMRLEVERR